MIQKIVSPLGIEAWLVEDYAVPLVAVDFAFRGGTAQDGAVRPGLAHMMSALLDEGAGPHDDEAFQRLMEENAVELSFQAGRDQINGSLRTLADRMEAGFDLLRLAITEPRFEETAVERIRQSLMASLRREASDPNAVASQTFFAHLFPGHPYGRPPRGTLESIAAIPRDEIAAQHRRLLAKDVLCISIVGAIAAHDARDMLDKVFGSLPTTALLQPVAETVPSSLGERRIVDLDLPQTVLQFGTPGVKRDSPYYMAALVLNHIYGGGSFSSRLFQKVREEKGLAYSVSTHLGTLAHAAFLGGGVATRNDRAAESLAIIEAEMMEIARNGPTAAELESAKKYLTGSYALRFDASTKIANQLTQIQVEKLGIDFIDRRNGLIDMITLDDTRRVARRLFGGPKPFVVAVGRPEGLA
ncbi:M16 family metallopeptidase [Labrys monachus]|uniref:Zinc protease n=1 Tax=Labrys monachus TaxID=217067 RepID=A0ABU0FLK8_9HYPH|nr:pitrilysin family protein [Labrys monachus]MDQ0394983.1 zinc protease [Labrys monachus]